MEHNELTHQTRPMWMVKNGLFYCRCKTCGKNMTAKSEEITDTDYFYVSVCKSCQKKD